MTTTGFHLEMNQALALCVVVASATLGAVDLVVGALLGVADVSPLRILWAFSLGAWAYLEWRRPDPNLLPLLLVGGIVTAVASLAVPLWDLPFEWYDEYTAYGILVGVAILIAVPLRPSRWVPVVISLVPALWALAFGLLNGRPIDAAIDWAIVAGATVAILHFVVRRLLNAAVAAANSQDDLVTLNRALARCSQVLLTDSTDDALDEALAALLEATAADYVSVDRTVYEGDIPGFEIVAEAASGPLPEGAEWMGGSYADLPTVLAAHLAGEVCALRRDELTGVERRLYERDGIEAELSVPIMVDEVWRGALAFANFRSAHDWSDTEIDALVQAAGLVAAYWKRHDDQLRLEKAIRSKDELIASVSHELRTPLTAVVGLAGEMAASATDFDASTMSELAGLVADQSRELADLVEDLLVAARVESNQLTIRCTEVRLLEEARSIVAAVGSTIPVEGWEGPALADPLRCRQVIRNLVTNAIRYGGENVVLTVTETVDSVSLTVSDDGVGVPELDVERIFELYERSRQVAPGSVGVGLAVSRNLAQLMGGALEYHRRDDRTEFCLSLPRVPLPPEANYLRAPALITR